MNCTLYIFLIELLLTFIGTKYNYINSSISDNKYRKTTNVVDRRYTIVGIIRKNARYVGNNKKKLFPPRLDRVERGVTIYAYRRE